MSITIYYTLRGRIQDLARGAIFLALYLHVAPCAMHYIRGPGHAPFRKY